MDQKTKRLIEFLEQPAVPSEALAAVGQAMDAFEQRDASYAATADELTKRVVTLLREQPMLAWNDEPCPLLKAGLKVDDLQPSLFQAQWAFAKAKEILKQEQVKDN